MFFFKLNRFYKFLFPKTILLPNAVQEKFAQQKIMFQNKMISFKRN